MAKRKNNSKTPKTIKPGVDVKGRLPQSAWALTQVSMCSGPSRRTQEKRTRRDGKLACAEG